MNKLASIPTSIKLSIMTVLITMGLASIEPLNWSDYLLHQAGTLIFLGLLGYAYHYFNTRRTSFIWGCVFLFIHIVGARYLYSYVPYDDWSNYLFGVEISELFGWQRNMYDRLVHFSYGLFIFPMILDMFCRIFPAITGTSKRTIILLVLQFNIATSTLYELFEWALAMGLSPEAAEAYNGQQGDMWDAQKDILLALIGGSLAAIISMKTKASKNNFSNV